MHRAQPVYNRICVDKELERNQNIHRQRLSDIQSSFRQVIQPNVYSADYYKLNQLKKGQINESRLTEIERENRILLEKITHIMTKSVPTTSIPLQPIQSNQVLPKITDPNESSQPPEKHHSSNQDPTLLPAKGFKNTSKPQIQRRKLLEINKLDENNNQMIKRIQAKKSHYSVREWEADFHKNINRAVSISHYPFNLFPLLANNNNTSEHNAASMSPTHLSSGGYDIPTKQGHAAVGQLHAQNSLDDKYYYSATGSSTQYLKRCYRKSSKTIRQRSVTSEVGRQHSPQKSESPEMKRMLTQGNRARKNSPSLDRVDVQKSPKYKEKSPQSQKVNTVPLRSSKAAASQRQHSLESRVNPSNSSSQQSPKKKVKKIRQKCKMETASELFPLKASSVILFEQSRNISGQQFQVQIRKEETCLLILAEESDSGDVKVIEIPRKEGLQYLKEECDGDPSSLALRLRLYQGRLYLIGTKLQSPTPAIPVGLENPSSLVLGGSPKHSSYDDKSGGSTFVNGKRQQQQQENSFVGIQREYKSAEKKQKHKKSEDISDEEIKNNEPPKKAVMR